MKLAAGLAFFQDILSLRRCLQSLHGHVDSIIAVDGRFAEYSHQDDLSTDGSRELVQSYPEAVLLDMPASSEVDKRNRYLQACKDLECDYMLWIDSDEYVAPGSNWGMFYNNCEEMVKIDNGIFNVYGVRGKILDPLPGRKPSGTWPRLWYKPWQMEHYRCHNVFRHKASGRTFYSPTSARSLIEGITILTDDALRDNYQLTRSEQYQSWLISHEGPLRDEMDVKSCLVAATMEI